MTWPLVRVISGGQSGVDRAGLEVARALGIPTGGTAPRGYRTEYGPDLALRDVFGLVESASADYDSRTLANVRDSDATVIFTSDITKGGSLRTRQFCDVSGKQYRANPNVSELRRFILEQGIGILNVAGNRHSRDPQMFDTVARVLYYAIQPPSALPTVALISVNPHRGR